MHFLTTILTILTLSLAAQAQEHHADLDLCAPSNDAYQVTIAGDSVVDVVEIPCSLSEPNIITDRQKIPVTDKLDLNIDMENIKILEMNNPDPGQNSSLNPDNDPEKRPNLVDSLKSKAIKAILGDNGIDINAHIGGIKCIDECAFTDPQLAAQQDRAGPTVQFDIIVPFY